MSLPAWTADQVSAMAPDPASAKAGQGLATPRKWVSLGRDARALWGECQGSGSKPYQVIVDASEPAFRCSCPSRKFPCKHGLGLLFIYAAQPALVTETDAEPQWVSDWLAMRESRAEKKAEKAEKPAPERAPDPAAQARRAAQREDRVLAGLDDLRHWLHDGVRQGLASLRGRARADWERVAARLVDAQAPGAARLVREMADVPNSGDGWPGRLLERMARLDLLVQAAGRMDALPEPVAADVRAALGWTARQEEVLAAGPGERDTWTVLGTRTEMEEKLRVQRTWLHGERTGRTALLLAFAAGGQPLEPGPAPGTRFDAELVFYAGNHPLRALVRERGGAPDAAALLPGAGSAEDALGAWAAALGRNPWTERIAVVLGGVVPVADGGGGWMLRDASGTALPLARVAEAAAWTLLAVGGGRPLDVAAEWDGESLLPLGAVADGRYLVLPLAGGAA